mmetsp:Transcript_55814/g.157242  ORF Transcript_55814/g.157242 Transcript_55814/m.157242 type:complete len:254 (-) Transcript_55814:443-1204(-)
MSTWPSSSAAREASSLNLMQMFEQSLETTTPVLQLETACCCSLARPASSATCTRSPASGGAWAGRVPCSSLRSSSWQTWVPPSGPSSLTAAASGKPHTTPRWREPVASSYHSARVPGRASNSASCASSTHLEGSHTPFFPGKSTAAAFPSTAMTRPRVPGGGRPHEPSGPPGPGTKRTSLPGQTPENCARSRPAASRSSLSSSSSLRCSAFRSRSSRSSPRTFDLSCLNLSASALSAACFDLCSFHSEGSTAQ